MEKSKFKSQFGMTLRFIACLLVQTFIMEPLSYAAPEIKALRLGRPEKLAVDFKIPDSVAAVEDSFKGSAGGKTVILFQDAHTNNSGQLNLAKALDFIFQSANKTADPSSGGKDRKSVV